MAEQEQTIETLLVKIAADTSGLRTELNKVNKETTATASNIKGVMKDAIATFGVPLTIGGILVGMKTVTQMALQLGDTFEKMQGQFDVSVDKLSAWAFAARHSNSDIEELQKSLTILSGKINEALTDPFSEAAESLRFFGISAEQLKAMRFEDVVEQIGKRVNELGPSAVATGKLREIMGKNASSVRETMSSLEELSSVAVKTGNTMDESFVKVAKSYDESSAKIADSAIRTGKTIASVFEPIYKSFAENMANESNKKTTFGLLEGDTSSLKNQKFSIFGSGSADKQAAQQATQQEGQKVGQAFGKGVEQGTKSATKLGDLVTPQMRLVREAHAQLTTQAAQFEAQTTDNVITQARIQAGVRTAAIKKMDEEMTSAAVRAKQIDNDMMRVKLANAALAQKQLDDIERTRTRAYQDRATETAAVEASMSDDVKTQAEIRYNAEAERLARWFEDQQRVYGDSEELNKQYTEALKTMNKQRVHDSRNAVEILLDDWKNATKQMEEATASWIDKGIDGLTEYAMTGKASFSDFAKSVIADLIRINLQKGAAQMFGGTGGAGGWASAIGSIFGFADGGDPPVGRASVVGEKGPELFIPKTAGTIIPNSAMGGGGGNTSVSIAVDARGSKVEGNESSSAELGNKFANAIRGVIISEKRPGGLLGA